MDTVRSFLRSVLDVGMAVIPVSVILGIIFGPAVPFIGADTLNNISALVADLGSISIGVGEWYTNEENGGRDYSSTGMSIAFNVNDDLSLSYGELEDTREAHGATTAVATEMKSVQVAYSMGSMAVKAKRVETDNPYQDTVLNATEHTELSVSFTF